MTVQYVRSPQTTGNLHNAKQQYKKVCQLKRRQASQNDIDRNLRLLDSNHNAIWGIVRRNKGFSPAPIPSNSWEDHFENLFLAPSVKMPSNYELANQHDYCYGITNPEPFQTTISMSEIVNAIALSKNRKAPGLDGIRTECLKHHIAVLLPRLYNFFNFCYVNAVAPEAWKTTRLISLYKGKGSVNDPNSYRGISLMSLIYKTFTSILHSRLSNWAETNRKLPDSQHGFRTNHSTITAVQLLMSKIQNGVAQEKRYHVVFVDFQKAFDCINRTLLLDKLLKLGVDYHYVRLLFSLLNETTIRVSMGDYMTEQICQLKGMPQGDRLSPLLFALFISDLSPHLETSDCDVLFYADDLAIGSSHLKDLQHAMYLLAEYCEVNSLVVNIGKTEMMKFRNGGGISESEKLYYNNKTLKYCSSFCYLGIKMTPKLSPIHHFQQNLTKCKGATVALFADNLFKSVQLPIALKLYKSTIFYQN